MGAVFVSYRRGDSEGQARALSLELVRLLGKNSVFMDVDSIALGRDFRQVLQERLGSCDLMMVLIGPGWLDAKDGSGSRRLDTATDFVRQEVAAALKRNIPVVPVLVQGAQVPPPERLPDDLKDLSYRNGFELGHSTWESDIREMVSRLGLPGPGGDEGASPTPATDKRPAEPPNQTLPVPPGRVRTAVLIALVVAGVGLLAYVYGNRDTGDNVAQVTSVSQPGTNTTAAASGGSVAAPLAASSTTTPIPAAESPAAGDGVAGSAIQFVWPGGDCWDIYRGTEYVTGRCGSGTQALGAGTYTIKGGGSTGPVFEPFTVTIKPATQTRIAKGGVFQFQWPAGDCWDVYRDSTEEYVTGHCGPDKQALNAGTYTIKGRHGDVFSPFKVAIKDGSSTRVAAGGVFEFKWPGGDCWDVYRGEQYVTGRCGAGKQALGAGTYIVKGRHDPVFEPFKITVRDGATTTAP